MTHDIPASTRSYNPVAKVLHWSVAVLIVLQLAIGWTMPDVHKGTRPEGEIGWHVTVGVLILLLVAARVLWRGVRPPVGVSGERGWMRVAASGTHVLLYLLIVVVPVLGWINAGSRDWVVGIGALQLPRLAAAGSSFGHDMGDVHGVLAVVLAVLIGLHVAAGFYHQFVLKDGTLRRML